MSNYQYYTKVFKKLLGEPSTQSKDIVLWDPSVLSKKKMFGNNIPFNLVMLSSVGPNTLSFCMKLKSDYSNYCNIPDIYDGASYLVREKSLYITADNLSTIFAAFRYIIGYNSAKFNLKDAIKGFRDEVYRGISVSDTDKLLMMKDNFTSMLSYMNIDSLESYVNLPPYMEQDSLNLAMESEANTLFYSYLDRKKKAENMTNRDIFNMVRANKFTYDTGDRTTSTTRKR